MKITEAFQSLQATQLFCVGYAWQDKLFGELTGHTVVDACGEITALRRFIQQNPHIRNAWIITGEKEAA